MRLPWKLALEEHARDSEARALLIAVPFLLLIAFSVFVKSADSSASFRVNKRAVLESLKREIALSSAPIVVVPPVAVAAPVEEVVVPTPELREVRETVRRGDTFGGILRRIGIDPDLSIRWSAASRQHASLTRLQPGHGFTFLLPSGTDDLVGLEYEISPDATLVMHRAGDEIEARVERMPRMIETRIMTGVVESSLYAAASRRGVPDWVVSSLVDIFGWDIDFSADLQAGDSFRVAYEETHDGSGRAVESGKVVAAELVVRSRVWNAVYFEADDDGGNYYSADGRPFGRSFLKYPVEFTRISSQFETARFHPVLGITRPHLGVDFAAPIGTPVRAIAAGRVEYAGWNGGSGRYVKLDHGSGLESSYSHLSAITRGLRAGERVQVGQVIGAVGASGLATGPHLHFALFRSGLYVNPLNVRLPAAPRLAGKFLPAFLRSRDELLQQLAEAQLDAVGTRVASVQLVAPAN